MNKATEIFKDLPEIMKPKFKMNHPNEDLCFYEGSFFLKWEGHNLELKGKIIFKWLPDLSVNFYGNFSENLDQSIIELFKTDLVIEITSLEPKFSAKGVLLRIRTDNENNNIVGYIKPPIIFGETKKKVDNVRFELPNLRDFFGIAVKEKTSGYKNRIIFENKEFIITLDKCVNYKELHNELKEKGGFILLYTGNLKSKEKGKISYEESVFVLNSFSYFLQFINGRRTSPILRYGLIDNLEQWKSITPYFNDRYKYVVCWPAKFKINGLSEIWYKFSELWKNESDRECLKTVLHWYVEANSNAAFIEGSIVLIQNALELLFHWLIAEKMKYVNASDADNISASAKIGFLLSANNISSDIPAKLEGLKKFAKRYNITNGPDSFIRIRNCIVHPSEKKRKTLKEIENKAKYEALNLGVWYVEVILLKQLEFKGEYQNRCKLFTKFNETDIIE